MTEETYHYRIDEDLDGERIDKVICSLSGSFSRSYGKKLIEEGHVLLNSKVPKASTCVTEGDDVDITLPPLQELAIEPENIPLDILYEDADLLVVNKPKDMVAHPAPGHYSGTLVNAIMYHCGSSLSGINGIMRPGIVHRIDKDTTGSLIVCKTDEAHRRIAEQLKNHSGNRIYHAIVYGLIKDDEGTITGNIGRSTSDRKKMAVVANGGKPAVTHYKVIQRFPQDNLTYIACKLETGRTHQIRVHMASIGHPLLGDELYATGRKSKWKLQGQCLHAKTIGFIHPITNTYMEIDAPLPDYFKHLLEILH